jgi:hypothetical protein
MRMTVFSTKIILFSELIALHDTLHCTILSLLTSEADIMDRDRQRCCVCDTLTCASAANHRISDGSDTTHATVQSKMCYLQSLKLKLRYFTVFLIQSQKFKMTNKLTRIFYMTTVRKPISFINV